MAHNIFSNISLRLILFRKGAIYVDSNGTRKYDMLKFFGFKFNNSGESMTITDRKQVKHYLKSLRQYILARDEYVKLPEINHWTSTIDAMSMQLTIADKRDPESTSFDVFASMSSSSSSSSSTSQSSNEEGKGKVVDEDEEESGVKHVGKTVREEENSNKENEEDDEDEEGGVEYEEENESDKQLPTEDEEENSNKEDEDEENETDKQLPTEDEEENSNKEDEEEEEEDEEEGGVKHVGKTVRKEENSNKENEEEEDEEEDEEENETDEPFPTDARCVWKSTLRQLYLRTFAHLRNNPNKDVSVELTDIIDQVTYY